MPFFFRRNNFGRKRRRFTAFSSSRKRFRGNSGRFTTRKRRTFAPKVVTKQSGTTYRRGRINRRAAFRNRLIQRNAAKLGGAHTYLVNNVLALDNILGRDDMAVGFLQSASSGTWAALALSFGLQATKDQIYVETITDCIDMQNASNMDQILHLYELIPRKNSVDFNPRDLFLSGLNEQGATSGSNFVPGWTPFDSHQLTTAYKINRSRKIYLKTGSRKQFMWKRKLNTKFDYSYTHAQDTIVSLRPFSKYYMFVSWGAPVSDLTTDGLVTNYGVHVKMTIFTKIAFRVNQVSAPRSIATDGRDVITDSHVIAPPSANTVFSGTNLAPVTTNPTAVWIR